MVVVCAPSSRRNHSLLHGAISTQLWCLTIAVLVAIVVLLASAPSCVEGGITRTISQPLSMNESGGEASSPPSSSSSPPAPMSTAAPPTPKPCVPRPPPSPPPSPPVNGANGSSSSPATSTPTPTGNGTNPINYCEDNNFQPNNDDDDNDKNLTLNFYTGKVIQASIIATSVLGLLGAPTENVMEMQSLVLLSLMKCEMPPPSVFKTDSAGASSGSGEDATSPSPPPVTTTPKPPPPPPIAPSEEQVIDTEEAKQYNPLQGVLGESEPAVTPFNPRPGTEYGPLAGNLIIVGGLTALHASAALGKKFGQAKLTLPASFAFMKFPSWSIKIVMLFYQGICFETFSVIRTRPANITMEGILSAGIGAIITAAVPISVIVFHVAVLPKHLVWRKYWPCPMPKANGIVKFFLLPRGYWTPKKFRSLFGAIFNAYVPKMGLIWCSIPFLRAIATSFILTAHREITSCTVRLQILAAMPIITALICLILRPYRALYQVAFTAIISLLYAGIVGIAGQKDSSMAPNVKGWYIQNILIVMGPLAFIFTTFSFVVSRYLERKWRLIVEKKKRAKKVAKKDKLTDIKQRKQTLKRKRMKSKKEERKEEKRRAGESSEEEEEEMSSADERQGQSPQHRVLEVPLLEKNNPLPPKLSQKQ